MAVAYSWMVRAKVSHGALWRYDPNTYRITRWRPRTVYFGQQRNLAGCPPNGWKLWRDTSSTGRWYCLMAGLPLEYKHGWHTQWVYGVSGYAVSYITAWIWRATAMKTRDIDIMRMHNTQRDQVKKPRACPRGSIALTQICCCLHQ